MTEAYSPKNDFVRRVNEPIALFLNGDARDLEEGDPEETLRSFVRSGHEPICRQSAQ